MVKNFVVGLLFVSVLIAVLGTISYWIGYLVLPPPTYWGCGNEYLWNLEAEAGDKFCRPIIGMGIIMLTGAAFYWVHRLGRYLRAGDWRARI